VTRNWRRQPEQQRQDSERDEVYQPLIQVQGQPQRRARPIPRTGACYAARGSTGSSGPRLERLRQPRRARASVVRAKVEAGERRPPGVRRDFKKPRGGRHTKPVDGVFRRRRRYPRGRISTAMGGL
jgi:hypothetical protein